MEALDRITFNPLVMGGKPCIRGMRITVGTVVGLVAAGKSVQSIVELYPYLEREDIRQALSWAAWRAEEVEVPFFASRFVEKVEAAAQQQAISDDTLDEWLNEDEQ